MQRWLVGIVWLMSSLWWSSVIAQTDIVVLPDGSELSGTLIDFRPGERVTLELSETGEVQTLAVGDYERVLQLAERKINMVPGELTPLPQIIAEVEDQRAVLYFRSGDEQKGEILDYERGGNIRLEVKNRAIYHYAAEDVKAISFDGGKVLAKRYRDLAFPGKPAAQTYAFPERGLFQHTDFAFTFGKTRVSINIDDPLLFPSPIVDPEQQTTGFHVQHLVGYQWNRWVGAGIGVAYDAYSLEGGEGMLSVLGHYRAYLTKTIRAPYLGISAGYGFPILDKDQGFIESQGGFMFHPELGMRLGASEKANFTVSVGYRWQEAYYVQEEPFTRDILYRDLVYRRLVVGLGMLF